MCLFSRICNSTAVDISISKCDYSVFFGLKILILNAGELQIRPN